MSSIDIKIECPANILNALKETLMNLHRKHEYFWQQSFMKLVAYPQGEPQSSPA